LFPHFASIIQYQFRIQPARTAGTSSLAGNPISAIVHAGRLVAPRVWLRLSDHTGNPGASTVSSSLRGRAWVHIARSVTSSFLHGPDRLQSCSTASHCKQSIYRSCSCHLEAEKHACDNKITHSTFNDSGREQAQSTLSSPPDKTENSSINMANPAILAYRDPALHPRPLPLRTYSESETAMTGFNEHRARPHSRHQSMTVNLNLTKLVLPTDHRHTTGYT
jgi:hypothetical protein